MKGKTNNDPDELKIEEVEEDELGMLSEPQYGAIYKSDEELNDIKTYDSENIQINLEARRFSSYSKLK